MENKQIDAPKKLKLLFTIVDKVKVDFFLQAIETFGVNFQVVLYARGTASPEMLQHLGAMDPTKALILSVVPEKEVKKILIAYEDRYFNLKNGKGMAFTVPFDSMIGLEAYQFLAGINFKEEVENGR